MATPHLRNFIDGRWLDAQSGQAFEDLDPATGEVIATATKSGTADVDRAVEAAHRAADAWRLFPAPKRGEILYKAGETEVHPCLGRLAFLLARDGVHLRWLTGGGDDDWTGLTPENTRAVPEHRRGPKELALKEGDWNALAVKMGPAAATLELNGSVIYEQPLAADDDRSHDRDLAQEIHDRQRRVFRWELPTGPIGQTPGGACEV